MTASDRGRVGTAPGAVRPRARLRDFADDPPLDARSSSAMVARHHRADRPARSSRRCRVVQSAATWFDAFAERRRVRPAGDGPQRRRRPGRPARPRLRGVLRDRRVRVRLRELAVLRAWTCRSCRCCSSAPRSPRSSASLLGAPTLRLRGDYLAIVTLGFGEIVPIVFLNLDKCTEGTNGIGGHLPARGAAVRRRVQRRSNPFAYYVLDGR